MTDQKLKTLREIADEVGTFPFKATTTHGTEFVVVGLGPGDKFLGWYPQTHNIDLKIPNLDRRWTLVTFRKTIDH